MTYSSLPLNWKKRLVNNMGNKKHITIIGAGLVGSLLSIYLQKRGYKVEVYERRPDMRKQTIRAGKSINLALSNRGWRPLAEVGLEDKLKQLIIPMKGRMMHDLEGNLSFQPYGKEGQAINSISRGGLNALLMETAESLGVKFHFEFKCTGIDFERTIAYVENRDTSLDIHSDLIFGADGAFSAVRSALQKTDRFNYSQDYIPHGYKELSFPATADDDFALDKNALHIWPRKDFMLIALPNLDKSFTVTLFLAFEGEKSFENLEKDEDVEHFFSTEFKDAKELMPNLVKEFKANPPSSLVTVRSYPWVRKNVSVIGDAAHAVVPFYGQGMIAGFEDCFVLNELLDKNTDNWAATLKEYEELRKPDTNAIADLALENFVVMREKVGDKSFLLRKQIESHLYALYPEKWIPLYSMVTFNENMRYSEAHAKGKKQEQIMDDVMASLSDNQDWKSLDFKAIVERV
jgi:kynurenine 3-monooxygenase